MRGILRFGALYTLGALCALGAGAACGNVNSSPDAAVPDASPDAPPDAPAATVHRWVVSEQRLPRTNAEAMMLGLDLNNDSAVDNQLGAVFAALSSQGFDAQAATDQAIARGEILLLGEATIGGDAPDAAKFTTHAGANPQPTPCNGAGDLVCRRHLQGTASFTLAPTSPRHQPLAGTFANGTLVAGPGNLQIQIGGFLPGAPMVLELIGARVRLQSVTAGSFGPGVIAGALSQAEVDTKFIPAVHQNAVTQVMADCTGTTPPDCGCAAGSTGKSYLNLFDTAPKNCVISLDEIRNNTLIQSLLAPDVTIEGQAALSFGFGVNAVKAAYTP
jgi:hypothetical protein